MSTTRQPGSSRLYDLFSRGHRIGPHNIAIDYGQDQLTYADVQADVQRIADQIVAAHGARPASVVLVGDKQRPFYETYLATCSLNSTVVPVTASTPTARIELIVDLVKPDLVVFCAATSELSARPGTTVAEISAADLTVRVTTKASEPARPAAGLDGIAYVLFTSGSTGSPKGVPVSGDSVTSYVYHATTRFAIGPASRLSHTFAVTFDLAVFDMFCAWSAGAALCVPYGRESALVSRYVASRRLTHWFSVPSAIRLAKQLNQLVPEQLASLRVVMFCGEPLPYDIVRMFHSAAPGARYLNLYGPTELTISVSAYELPASPADWPLTGNGTVPIGPLHPGHSGVLIDGFTETPSSGELCVRGPQRFSGYLRPEDGKEVFVIPPGSNDNDYTPAVAASGPDDYYRTGDRVLTTEEGYVHLGRIDEQIKVGGHRLEPAEIEQALRGVSGIDAAVVVVVDRPGGSKLVALCTGDRRAVESARATLKKILPQYMIPDLCEWLPDLPVNVNGKTDRRLLQQTAQGRL